MKSYAIVIATAGLLVGWSSAAYSQGGAKALFYTEEGATTMPKPPPQRQATATPKVQRDPRTAATPAERTPETPKKESYLGIKYAIELVGKDGTRVEVTPDRVFQSGDRIKVRVETNRDGYLYLLNVGSTGRYHLLFPHPKLSEGSNFVKARAVYDIPYGAFIRFDDNPGEESLLVMLSPYPMTEPAPSADPRTRVVPPQEGQRIVRTAQARGAKDLTLEVDTAGTEPAAYAVAPLSSLGEQGMLVLEIKLRHR